jgi:hypothetical protein
MIIMSGRIVARYLKSMTEDMLRNKRKKIRCPCQRCKQGCFIDPFSGCFKEHLLMHGFMDGYTLWISEDDEYVDGEGNEEGQENNDDVAPDLDE